MKSAILLALFGAVAVCAQNPAIQPRPTFSDTSNPCLAPCGNGMYDNIADDFKCIAGDVACGCSNGKQIANVSFANGVRDCASRACNLDVNAANEVIQWGIKYCADAGAPITITNLTAAEMIPPAGGASSPVAAPTTAPSTPVISTFTTVITPSTGSPFSSTGTTTLDGAGGAPSPTSGGPAVTASTGSGGSVAPSGAPTDSATTADTTSAAPSSSNVGSQATAAPVAGLIAAAGLAAALL